MRMKLQIEGTARCSKSVSWPLVTFVRHPCTPLAGHKGSRPCHGVRMGLVVASRVLPQVCSCHSRRTRLHISRISGERRALPGVGDNLGAGEEEDGEGKALEEEEEEEGGQEEEYEADEENEEGKVSLEDEDEEEEVEEGEADNLDLSHWGSRGRSEAAQDEDEAEPTDEREKGKTYLDYVILKDDDPFYAAVLTDEKDPPGHKSGYVAVIGKPNAGKSTLINTLVGQKLSIVTPKVQTTRHRVMGIASEDHYQMILFDTPGVMEVARTKLDARMMAAVQRSCKDAEAVIAVVDATTDVKDALAMFQPNRDWTGPPMAVLLNKCDLLDEGEVQSLLMYLRQHCRAEVVFEGSALNNTGIEAIKQWAVSKLPDGPTLYPKELITHQPERFFVSELIREKIYLLYEEEIPYCSQVHIEVFKERPKARDYIEAIIYVEKDSQVGVLVGKAGQAMKQLGQESRKAIEEFLQRPVYLKMQVKVTKGWRNDDRRLHDLGYYSPLYI